MKNPPAWLSDIRAAHPRDILLKLAQYSQATAIWRSGAFDVKVFLASGPAFEGTVFGVTALNEGYAVLLAKDVGPDVQLTYLALSDVTTVEFLATDRLREALAPHLNAAPEGSAPTQLQLKRNVETLSQALSAAGLSIRLDVTWEFVADAPDEHKTVDALLNGVDRLLRAIASDSMGQQALGGIQRIVLRSDPDAPKLTCQRQGPELTIRGAFKRPLRNTFEEDLRRDIEAVL